MSDINPELEGKQVYTIETRDGIRIHPNDYDKMEIKLFSGPHCHVPFVAVHKEAGVVYYNLTELVSFTLLDEEKEDEKN